MTQEKEFTLEIEKNKGIIRKVIRLYVDDPEEQRDLFQEIIFQSWKSYPRFGGRSKFSTWLYRIALNTVLTFRRKPQLVKPYEDLSALNVPHDKTYADESEALYHAIRELNELDRMIITLHLDGYDNEEIAEITGLTKNNTAVKIHRIKDHLIEKLKD